MKYNSNEIAEKLSNPLHFHLKLTFFSHYRNQKCGIAFILDTLVRQLVHY